MVEFPMSFMWQKHDMTESRVTQKYENSEKELTENSIFIVMFDDVLKTSELASVARDYLSIK